MSVERSHRQAAAAGALAVATEAGVETEAGTGVAARVARHDPGVESDPDLAPEQDAGRETGTGVAGDAGAGVKVWTVSAESEEAKPVQLRLRLLLHLMTSLPNHTCLVQPP